MKIYRQYIENVITNTNCLVLEILRLKIAFVFELCNSYNITYQLPFTARLPGKYDLDRILIQSHIDIFGQDVHANNTLPMIKL